jgi:hypothetical protein
MIAGSPQDIWALKTIGRICAETLCRMQSERTIVVTRKEPIILTL